MIIWNLILKTYFWRKLSTTQYNTKMGGRLDNNSCEKHGFYKPSGQHKLILCLDCWKSKYGLRNWKCYITLESLPKTHLFQLKGKHLNCCWCPVWNTRMPPEAVSHVPLVRFNIILKVYLRIKLIWRWNLGDCNSQILRFK